MKLPRRNFLHLAAGAAALPAVARFAWAQSYPSRPVRLIVPLPPVGATDGVAHLIAQWLSERLGQSFVVENRPGDNSNVATEAVVRAPADGYTLLEATLRNASNATLYQNLNFTFIRDIAPIAFIGRIDYVIQVNPSFPAKTVPELITFAKANPGKVRYASPGTGSPGHMAGELFNMMTGAGLARAAYSNAALALADVVSGQAQVMFESVSFSIENNRAGKLRALAVTSSMRSGLLPDVPLVADFLPGFEASPWLGIAAPKDTPVDIIGRLNKEINAALADPKVKAQLAEQGTTPSAGSPADFAKIIADDTENWGKVVKFAGIKAD